MTNRLLAVLIIFPIWLTLVLVFRRQRQWLLYYLVAAFGLTIQLVFLAEYFGIDQLLVNVASFHVNLISKGIFHIPMELLSNGRFQMILNSGNSSILKLGIECSAILESSVILSLVVFYPLFGWKQKILRAAFGLVVTYVINILRLMIIVLMAYKFGPDYIFLAHAGVARVFFFLAELMLYWYLITKPTVKSVGVAIKDGITLEKAAEIGQSLQFKHAIAQLSVILIVIQISILTFGFSGEWQKSFANIRNVNRPIIYQDETSLTPTSDLLSSLNQEIVLNLKGGEKSLRRFDIQKEEKLNVKIIKGAEDLAGRLIINGKSVELVTLAPWLFDKTNSIFKPFTVKPGDILEFKFQNLAEEPSQYLVKIYPEGKENAQICTLASLPSEPTPQPQPTPQPSTQTQGFTDNKSVAGLSSASLYQEIALDLLAGQKTLFRFDIQKEEELNVQVLEGQEDLAARLILNGQNIGFVSFAPWRFDKYISIFEPFKVKPGDVLELRFQNLSEEEPSQYLIKIYPSGDEDE